MKRRYTIAVVPGDGTGPEVVREGIKVLNAAAGACGFALDYFYVGIGADHYRQTGEIITDRHLASLAGADAIFFGAIGHPEVKAGVLEKGIILKIRFHFDQYINLRPVKLYEGVASPLRDKRAGDIDFVVVRENTEGLYAGAGGSLKRGTPDEVAVQESINTRKGVERCVRFAFEHCRLRNRRKKLTLCGKTNVLTYAFDLWERTFYEVAEDYPDIECDYVNVDALCMWLVKNPERYDVIVTDNMFGDIISDLAAMLQGGLGVSAGANLNPEGLSMFEPIGGSAPKYAGQNVINPIAAILAARLLLETLGETDAAARIEAAVAKVLRDDIRELTTGRMGHSTEAVGDLVAAGVLARPRGV
jgi:3-isopropylmalate dehydrogenase